MAQPGGQSAWQWNTQVNDWVFYNQNIQRWVTRGESQRANQSAPRTVQTTQAAGRSVSTSSNPPSSPTAHPSYIAPPADARESAEPELQGTTQGVSQVTSSGAQSAPQIANLSLKDAASTVVSQRPREGVVDSFDRRNGVRSTVQTGPAEQITDPVLLRAGIRAHKKLLGAGQETEQLYPTFQRRKQPRRFFVCGKVFMILWAEPAGEPNNSVITSNVQSDVIPGKFGQRIFSKVRRFIVIRESELYCSALSIMSYGGQGVSKRETIKSEHGIVYVGEDAPSAIPAELATRNDSGMQPVAIRIIPDDSTQKLQPMSRINYGKVYTIEHNVKVHNIGAVDRESRAPLLYQFNQVWSKSIGATRGLPPVREGQVESFGNVGQSSSQIAHAVQGAAIVKPGSSQQAAIEAARKRHAALAGQKGVKKAEEVSHGNSDESDHEGAQHQAKAGDLRQSGSGAAVRAAPRPGLSKTPAVAKTQLQARQGARTQSKLTHKGKEKQVMEDEEDEDEDEEEDEDDDDDDEQASGDRMYDPVVQAKIRATVTALRQRGMSEADAIRYARAGIAKQRAAALERENLGKGKAPAASKREEDEGDEEDDEESEESGESDEASGEE